ncbi:MAG: ABC transporter ATP-binding protein [Chloroflexi bacterium]|nr:ABC transporter ATP-binding protein [Chloroflexota bacterium]
MIHLNHVTKRYHDFTAVDDLDFHVAPGEIIGIIGHNGAGKSTTLKMIAGLIAPTHGTVYINGRDIQKHSVALKRQLGYLPEENPLYENMTARQYLLFFSELYDLSRAAANQRIDSLLASLHLEDSAKLIGEFSKGMKRKVAIARALLHDPALLILDEPNSGLDPLTSFFIIGYLKSLKYAQKTILLSAHNLFHVEYICDRVAIIKNGKLVVFDTMEAIRAGLGKREYQIVFKTDEPLEYEHRDGNYVYRTHDIDAIAAMLQKISDQRWALIDLSVQESALEEIYVKLMTNP